MLKLLATRRRRDATPRSRSATGKLRGLAALLAALCIALPCLRGTAAAQEAANIPARVELPGVLSGNPSTWTSPEGLTSTIQVMLLLTVLSLAPAVLLMTTSFVRIVVVLGLLRQASARSNCRPAR